MESKCQDRVVKELSNRKGYTQPRVSIIMPSYNHKKFLSEAIQSVLSQSFDEFEFIIIDDGSIDESQKMIENFANLDTRIKTIFHTKNLGISKTLNEGIELSRGEFLAFISSDDIWMNDKIAEQIRAYEKGGSPIIWSEGLIIDEKGVETGEKITKKYHASQRTKSGNILSELLIENFPFGLAILIKKSAIGKLRFDPTLKYVNDYKFFLELARSNDFYFIERPLWKYRQHPGSTNRDHNGYALDSINLYNFVLKEFNSELSS